MLSAESVKLYALVWRTHLNMPAHSQLSGALLIANTVRCPGTAAQHGGSLLCSAAVVLWCCAAELLGRGASGDWHG